MAKSSEEISKYNTSGGKPDSNLANDTLHVGGIPAEDFATHKYVQDYHDSKEALLKEYVDEQDGQKLQEAKAYTDTVVHNQDFSSFAKLTDVQALDDKLSGELETGLNTQKNYTDNKVQALANDVNDNFDDVGQSIASLNSTTQQLFTSVSNGKRNVAAAITDQGVETASDASFDTMATNIRKIPTGGGEPDPYYVNTGDATAVANDILLGKTAYVKGEKIYGSHIDIDTSDANATQEDIMLGKSAYVDGQKVYGTHIDTGVDTSDATATPYDILEGQTAYVNGQKITGILNISGEKPTYCSDSGVEKIYGGGFGDYTINTISNLTTSNPLLNGVLYNSNTMDIDAIVKGITNEEEIIIYYIYNDSIGMTRTIDISNVLETARTQLSNYSDYASATNYTFELSITTTNAPNPYIALIYGSINKKEVMLIILPLIEVHSQQSGATVVTWEIDFNNIIYYPITTASGYLPINASDILVSENGETIFYATTTIIKVNIDTLSISNAYIGSYMLSNHHIHSVSTDRIVIYDKETSTGTGITTYETHMMIYDENHNLITDIKIDTTSDHRTYRFTDNLQYCISCYGEVYIVSIDYTNFQLNLTRVQGVTVNLSNYMKYNYSFEMLGDKYIITSDSNNNNNIYEFNPLEDTLLKLVDENNYLFDINNFSYYRKIGNTFLYSAINTNVPLLRTMKMMKDYGQLIALKYNGEYFYRQEGGILTAGQPDVKAGKSFIGWMGYPEIGTMEVE